MGYCRRVRENAGRKGYVRFPLGFRGVTTTPTKQRPYFFFA